jgi:hypothetical protein
MRPWTWSRDGDLLVADEACGRISRSWEPEREVGIREAPCGFSPSSLELDKAFPGRCCGVLTVHRQSDGDASGGLQCGGSLAASLVLQRCTFFAAAWWHYELESGGADTRSSLVFIEQATRRFLLYFKISSKAEAAGVVTRTAWRSWVRFRIC